MANFTNSSLLELILQTSLLPGDVAVCGLVLGLVCVTSALFGNGLIVVTVWRERRLRKRQNTFVVSLAVCEILMVCTRDIFMLATYGRRQWAFGSDLAVAFNILDVCRNSLTIGHIVAITVYRYALIIHPKAFNIMLHPAFLVFVGVLLVTLPFGSTIAASRGLFTDEFAFNTKVMRAYSPNRLLDQGMFKEREIRADNTGIIFIYLFVNVVLLVGCYVHIYVFMRRSRATVEGWARETGVSSQSNSIISRLREVRFVKTMAVVFASFVLAYFWTPTLSAIDRRISWSHWVYFPFVMINWFSSSINWVVYGLTHPAFNQGFRRALGMSTAAQVAPQIVINKPPEGMEQAPSALSTAPDRTHLALAAPRSHLALTARGPRVSGSHSAGTSGVF